MAATKGARRTSSRRKSSPSKRKGGNPQRQTAKRKPATTAKAGAPSDELKKRASDVRKRLARVLPRARPELSHDNAWQLLVATILSAQSTDRKVNSVTPTLFRKFPTPEALGNAPQEQIEQIVRPTGFYRNKAKSIRESSRAIAEHHGGEVPQTIEEMVALPGVARKTANVVLGAAYGIPTGIVVDTHAGRVARRLGLTEEQQADKVERDLCALFPESAWIDMSHRLVLHGRYLCTSKCADCAECPLNELCSSAESEPQGRWTKRADAEGARIRAGGHQPE